MTSRWGITLAEMRVDKWPSADRHSLESEEIWFRGVHVNAPPEKVFRWICQLRVAPYSYDWIDNFGRQSPRHLVSGLEQLRIGQKVMEIFSVSDFAFDHYMTIILWPPRSFLCSDLRITYLSLPVRKNETRLLVRVQICYPKHAFRSIICALLPSGDLVMMRKQLLTLKHLAEQSGS
jgi:hypothetical protein